MRGAVAIIIADMNEPADRVWATKRIAVTAHQVFLAVTDPMCHVRIDGSSLWPQG